MSQESLVVTTENADARTQVKLDNLDARAVRLDSEVSNIRQRLSRLEGIVEQMSERLTDMNSRLNILTAAVITQTIAMVGLIAAVLLKG